MSLPKYGKSALRKAVHILRLRKTGCRWAGAPIQAHMGDFIIGFPASTENTVFALQAGVTTIGNLSQFFAMRLLCGGARI